MANAGTTTLSTTPTTLHNAATGDRSASAVLFFNTSTSASVMVNVAPLHNATDFLTIPPAASSGPVIPVELRCKGHQIQAIVAKAAGAGSPVLNWSVSEV